MIRGGVLGDWVVQLSFYLLRGEECIGDSGIRRRRREGGREGGKGGS